jgi:hypothetical protein
MMFIIAGTEASARAMKQNQAKPRLQIDRR